MAVAGNRIGDISHAIQEYVEAHGYSVVREFVGHGLGRELHEDPEVPNYGHPGRGARLVPGMTLAIEPMVNAGTAAVRQLETAGPSRQRTARSAPTLKLHRHHRKRAGHPDRSELRRTRWG